MGIVNKEDLARDVAARIDLDVSEARRVLEATIAAITAQVADGNEVRLTGFGKFTPVHREAREGRNPQTGEAMQIAAKTVPKFSAGAEFKKAVE